MKGFASNILFLGYLLALLGCPKIWRFAGSFTIFHIQQFIELGATSTVINWNPNWNCLSLPQRIGLTQTAAERHRCMKDSCYFTPKHVLPSQGSVRLGRYACELREALGMGEHLLKRGWPLSKSLKSVGRRDAKKTCFRDGTNITYYMVRFITSSHPFPFFTGNGPARCR